ncbi:hypothetical protein HHI36_023484 [Cryptolaemus montrouzieri]|uniref:Ribosomal protein eL8/eL30/eS12/Gadd45 domain-containing protein n=1 Tax=Cryptolaemus montrouzieri TaxID=559131 RepID=A0ABD2PH18_9CUCU
MANSYGQKRSQGSGINDIVRFPDPFAFEDELRRCNKMAIPLGNRSVTNKCYALLFKVNFFPSSVFEGVEIVHEMLQMPLHIPCLVLMAADTNIVGNLASIQALCVKNGIPHIFIPTKAYIGDALYLKRDVLAVLITFDNDPGYRVEFEDAFEEIQSQCFRKRGRHHRGNLTSTTPTVEPNREMVTASVSTDSTDVRIYELLDEPSTSSSWVFSNDYDSDNKSMDVSVDMSQDEPMEENFQELIPVTSSNPALPLTQMGQLQDQMSFSMNIGEGSSSTMSCDDSKIPGPSHRSASSSMLLPRKRPPTPSDTETANKRRTRFVSLPLGFNFRHDDGSNETNDNHGSGEGLSSTVEACSANSGNSSPQDIETDD